MVPDPSGTTPTGSLSDPEELRLIADALPMLIAYIDPSRRYRFCNRAYERWFGLAREDVIGRAAADVVGAEAYAAVGPQLDRAFAGETIDYEADVRYHHAGVRHVHSTYVPDVGPDGEVRGVVVLVEDVTRRHESERERGRLAEQIAAERAWLEGVLQQLPAGVVIRSADGGRLLMANRETTRILGQPLAEDLSPEQLAAYVFRTLDGRLLEPEELPMHRVLREGVPVRAEVELERADGRRSVLRLNAGPVRDAAGRLVAAVLTFDDVTERRRAEEALRFLAEASAALGASLDYEATLATVARLAVPRLADWCAIDLVEADGRLRRLAVTHADPEKERVAWELTRRFPDDPARGNGAYGVLRSGEPLLIPTLTPEMLALPDREPEFRRLIQDLGLVSYIGVPLVAHGEAFGVLTLVMSESGRHYDESDLRLAVELGERAAGAVDNARRHSSAVESLNMLDAVLAAAPVGQAFVDRELRYVRVNPALVAMTGTPAEAVIGRRVGEVQPAWGGMLRPLLEGVIATGRPILNRELPDTLLGEGRMDLLGSFYPVRDAAGAVRWVGITITDVTEQRRSERARRQAEVRARALVEQAALPMLVFDTAGRPIASNPAWERLWGTSLASAPADYSLLADAQLQSYGCQPLLERAFAGEAVTLPPIYYDVSKATGTDGAAVWVQGHVYPVFDAEGRVEQVAVVQVDVTEQKRAEDAVRASEARLRRVVESPMIGIGFYGMDGRITGANAALRELLGYTEAEAGALRWDRDFTPPEHAELDRLAGAEIAELGVCRPYEKELLRKDGSRVPVLAGGARLDDGDVNGVFFILDLTERRRVEEQAQAAQRLEAVGRLAGGVAHEINNALQGVLGFGAFALRRLGADHPARADVEQVQLSGERAAKIAQQLLAYSRRQVLQPVDLDLVRLVGEFTLMLRQALGPDKQLLLRVAPEHAVVHADRGQLEQVLLNLALNARDAMSSGGRLVIGLARRRLAAGGAGPAGAPATLAPGDWIELTVEDTGTGMDRATQARVFEPFFTTKPPGQGTGLGLSVVHGIVQQSGGHVWLASEPGRGSTFTILLPEVGRDATPQQTAPDGAPGGRETVLVVDDEPMIREFATMLLSEAGYRVLAAADGGEALELATGASADGPGRGIDIVVTDVVMPGVGGRALGEALAERLPAVPVLYTSGYTGDEVVRRGLVAAGVAFLQKPFAPEDLLRRVRRMLDRDEGE